MTNASQAASATALVFSNDRAVLRLLVEALTPFAIRLRMCSDTEVAIGLLRREKFEAVLGDLERGADASLVFHQMRLSPANRTAVTFAITAKAGGGVTPMADAMFVLHRPLTVESIRNTVRAAFGMVVRERRRYFRCPVVAPAFVQTESNRELSCTIVNISEGGLAVSTAEVICEGIPAARFTLPGESGEFLADTEVCWRLEKGSVGLRFLSLSRKPALQEWLARKLDERLPEEVVRLFRGAG